MKISADVRCQAILNGLLQLEAVLDRPLAREALERADPVTTQQKKSRLIRLRHSLVQYLERTGDVAYVALLGHFSSGKSSTINSLLRPKDSHRRRVGLNPTDTMITLITNEKHVDSLLGVVVQSSVPIRVQPIESDLLNHLVIVDTPGTGDPHLIKEMARDFLPMCDLVMVLFSAASPFDETDLPLLTELHTSLPFIPLLFVITRADELSVDPRKQLSEENLDSAAATTFLTGLLSRVNLILQPAKYGDKDFILIDNLSGYNIEKLRQLLLDRLDPTNVSARVVMHSYKVAFFQNMAQTLCDFFSNFLDEKLRELSRVVTTAQANINKYENSVNLTNVNLTHSWVERYDLLQDLRAKTAERIRNRDNLPTSFFNSAPIANLSATLQADIHREAKRTAEQIRQHVVREGFSELHRELNRVRDELRNADLEELSPQHHGLMKKEIDWALGELEIFQVLYLARKADDRRDAIRRFIVDELNHVRRSFEDIQKAIHQRLVLSKCEEIVSAAELSLEQDLELYFRSVEVYREGVFSAGARGSISKLGIGDKLDSLKGKFTNEDKESIKITAKQNLFPSFGQIVASATTQLTTITDELRSIMPSIYDLELDEPPSMRRHLEDDANQQLATITDELKRGLQSEANDFVDRAQTRLAGVIATRLHAYISELTVARSKRRSQYTILAGSTGLASLILVSLNVWMNRSSTFRDVWWAVIAAFLGVIIGVLVARLRDSYPDRHREIAETNRAKLNDEIASALDALVKDHRFVVLGEAELVPRLAAIYSKLINRVDDWQVHAEEQYRKLRTLNTQYQEMRQRYLKVINSLIKDCGTYFEDQQKNLAVLESTTKSIKEEAIEPSFEVLAQTRSELSGVKDELSGIRFS